MQASMSEIVQFLEGRDDSVHHSTENQELMEPRSPSGVEDSRALSKQLDDSNKLPPPSVIDELLFGFLGISDAQRNSNANNLSKARDVVPPGPSALKPSEPIDGSNEGYGGNWVEGFLEEYDYTCTSYAHEEVVTTGTQSPGPGDKDSSDRTIANVNEYSLDVLTQEKLDVQGFQVEEASHMASAPSVIDTEEDSTFFEDIGFDMRNSSELKDCKNYYDASTSEINAEGSSEDVSPACSNLHIVPMSDGMMEVTSSPPEEFAVPMSRDGGVEISKVPSPDVAKVPICAGVGQPSLTCQAIASVPRPIGAVVKNQIVLPFSGDTILSETLSDSLDSLDCGMPELVRADDPPSPVASHVYDTPPELEPADQSSSANAKKGVKTTTSTLASAAGEDLLQSSKKMSLGVVPETIQEATSQEELNHSLGKIVPSFTPDMSNQMPAYMNAIYDVGNISLKATCSTPSTNVGVGGSLPLLPITEEPKVYKTFEKTPVKKIATKKTKSPDIKTKDSCGVDKGFVRDLLRSVNGGPNRLSGPNCVVEFRDKVLVKPSVRKNIFAEVPSIEKRMDSKSDCTMKNSVVNTSGNPTAKSVCSALIEPKTSSALSRDLDSLPDLPSLLDIRDVRTTDEVPFSLSTKDGSPDLHTPLKRNSNSEHLPVPGEKPVSYQSNKAVNIIQTTKQGKHSTSPPATCASSTLPKKTLTLSACVPQDVVCETKAPDDEMKSKKSVHIKAQDKPPAYASEKSALVPPQELKVSLPISSLDLLSVKIIGVGSMENAHVVTGVSIPTMAQRKQYVDVNVKSSPAAAPSNEKKHLKHFPNNSSKNQSVIPNNKVVYDVLSPNISPDSFTNSEVLSMDVNNDGELLSIPQGTKDNNVEIKEPYKIADKSKRIHCMSSSKKIYNRSSQIDEKPETQKKSESSSRPVTDEMELTDVLKEHPVITVVNSLIQSASKLPDLFEETNEVSSDGDGKQDTTLSKVIDTMKENSTSSEEVVEKQKDKAKRPVENRKPSLDVAQRRRNTSNQTGERQIIEPQGEGGGPKTLVEKSSICLSHIYDKKVDIPASKEMTDGQPSNKTCPNEINEEVDEQKSLLLKSVSLPVDTYEQKLVTPRVVDRRKTRLSLDSVETSLGNVKGKHGVLVSRAQQDVVLTKNVKHDLVGKQNTAVPEDSLGQQKTSSAEISVVPEPIPTDITQKRETADLQDVVDKSQGALSGVVIGRRKPMLSQAVVDDTKPTVLQETVAWTKSANNEMKPPPAQVKVDGKKPSPVAFENPEAVPIIALSNSRNVTPKVVDEAVRITPSQVVNSASSVEKEHSKSLQGLVENKTCSVSKEKYSKRKPAIDKLKTANSKVRSEEINTISLQDIAPESKGKVQNVANKGVSRNLLLQEVFLEKKTIHSKVSIPEKKTVVGKPKAVVDKIAVPHNVAEKHKSKSEVLVEKENPQILQDAEGKINCVVMQEQVSGKDPSDNKPESVVTSKTEATLSLNVVERKDVVRKESVQKKEKSVRDDINEGRPVVEKSKILLNSPEKLSKDPSKEIVVKTGALQITVGKNESGPSNKEAVLSKVTAGNKKTGSNRDLTEKPKEDTRKPRTQTSQKTLGTNEGTLPNEKGVLSKVVKDNKKTVSDQDVSEKTNNDDAKKVVEKWQTQTSQEIMEKNQVILSGEISVLPKVPAENLSAGNKKTASGVAETSKKEAEKVVGKECIRAVHEAVGIKKSSNPKEVNDRKPAIKKLKIKMPKTLVDNGKTSNLQDVVEKLRGKVENTLVNEGTVNMREVREKNNKVWSEEVALKRNAEVHQSKSIVSEVVVDNMNVNEPQDLADKPKEKVQDRSKKISTQALHEDMEGNKLELPSIKVVKTRKSALEGMDPKRKTTSLEDLIQKPEAATSPGQKLFPEALKSKNAAVLKKSKSSDLLAGVCKSRTTAMFHKACKLQSENVVSKREISKESAKKPSLGHWRIVKQSQQTTSVKDLSVPGVDVSVEIPQNAAAENKTRSRRRSEVSVDRSSVGSEGVAAKQCLEKEQSKQSKPAVESKPDEENKTRLRTRSETSNERKLKHDGAVAKDKQATSNHPQQVVVSSKNTTKQTVESVANTLNSNKTSVKSSRKASVDRKPVSPMAVPVAVIEDNKHSLKTRIEALGDKKVEGVKSSTEQVSKNRSKGSSKTTDANVMPKTAHKAEETTVSEEIKSIGGKLSSGIAVVDLTHEETKTRLRTRSETLNERKLDNLNPQMSIDERVGLSVSLPKRGFPANKYEHIPTKDTTKDETGSLLTNQPLNATESMLETDIVDKTFVNDVYDFTEDEIQSNIHTIDQFRNLSGKSTKNKRTQAIGGTIEMESTIVTEHENKLNCSTRKSRFENGKANDRNPTKLSPKKLHTKKETVVFEKISKGNISDKKSSPSSDLVSTEAKKENCVQSSDNRTDLKEYTETRSRSRDLASEEGSVSPTRVLRSKVKHDTLTHRIVDSEDGGHLPPEPISDIKVRATSKMLDNKPAEKCDSTTTDSVTNHGSPLMVAEVVDSSLKKRKTRSSIKLTPKEIENSARETSQLSKDNFSPKLRSSRKLNGSPLTVKNQSVSVDTNLNQLNSLSDTVSLKSEIVGDELKITIKRVTMQNDKADSSVASEANIAQKSIKETSVADVENKDKMKPVKTSVVDVAEVLSNQSTMLSVQDTAACNAEAVSLKTPLMGSVVTPEPDNIQAVSDMSQHREPEGAKSSTRTAQLRSLVSPQDADRDQTNFHGDKGRVERKRLARERSIMGKGQSGLEDMKDKPQKSTVNAPTSVDFVKQLPQFDGHCASRGSSSTLQSTKPSALENLPVRGNNEIEEAFCRRVTRSSLSGAMDSVKSSIKEDLENDISKPRKGTNGSVTGPSAVQRNCDARESSGFKNKKSLKEGDKQLGKRPVSELECIQTIDEVPVKAKLRKTETTTKLNFIEPKSECLKIMAPITNKQLMCSDKNKIVTKGVVSRSSVETEIVAAKNKIPVVDDSICSVERLTICKEKSKKDVDADVSKTSSAPVSVSRTVISSTPMAVSSPVIINESVTEHQKPEKSSSRRKSKVTPPTKRISSVTANLMEAKLKASVKEVCSASESLDKILREEGIKEIPSDFDTLAQSPGKSPDSTTQSRADIVISKLAQEPPSVNQKISEDSQGVTSTTEIETVSMIIETPSSSSAVHEAGIHDVAQGKKEDESVTSTTVDSKLSTIPYLDSKYVDIIKKHDVKASRTLKQSVNKTTVDIKKQSLDKVKNLETVNSKKLPTSDLGIGSSSSKTPEYDVLHPRMKIWRKASSRENETSNQKTLSDEKLRGTPLKKRQVRGLDDRLSHDNETSRSEEQKTLEKSEHSPTSSVDQLPHSIYKILSVGPGDMNTQAIQREDSRSGSKECEVISRLSRVRRKVYKQCRKSLKKGGVKCSEKNVSRGKDSCRRRMGLQRSRLMVSFPQRKAKVKVKQSAKNLKRIKPPRTTTTPIHVVIKQQPGKSLDQPKVVDKGLETPAKCTDVDTRKSFDIIKTVEKKPKLVQKDQMDDLPKPSFSDTPPTATVPILPVMHNNKQLTVDPWEEEEASPQFSPHRPLDQDSSSQDLSIPLPTPVSCSGFTPVTPQWTKQSISSGLMVASSPTAVVPRPIIERSRSFSSLGRTSKPRARRESDSALSHAHPSPTPVDLSFRSKKSLVNPSPSLCTINPEGTNVGKLDLYGQNPTFSTSLRGDVVTFDLAQNQVVCMKPSTTTLNRSVEPVPPMNMPMSDQLISPIRPIPLTTYPPLPANKVKDLLPATKSSLSDYSCSLYQQRLSAFHAMNGNKASINHEAHFMFTPADIPNMSGLCAPKSLAAPSRQTKNIRSNRTKRDAPCSTSFKDFTNPKFHEDARSTPQQPLFNKLEGRSLPYISDGSYNLGYVINPTPALLPSTLNTTCVLSVASGRYNNQNDRNDQSLIEVNQKALQKVVREFNDGMKSIKNSHSVSISSTHSSNVVRTSDSVSVKNFNLPKCTETVPTPGKVVTPCIDTDSDPSSREVGMTTEQVHPHNNVLKSGHCDNMPPEQAKVIEQAREQVLKESTVILKEAPKTELCKSHDEDLVARVPKTELSVSNNKVSIATIDHEQPKIDAACDVVPIKSCLSSDTVQCIISPPTADNSPSKDQVANNSVSIALEEQIIQTDSSGGERKLWVTEIKSSSGDICPSDPTISKELELNSQQINPTLKVNQTINSELTMTESLVVSNDEESESRVVSKEVEPESQVVSNDVESDSQAGSSGVKPESRLICSDVEHESRVVSNNVKPDSRIVGNGMESESRVVSSNLEPESRVVSSGVEFESNAVELESSGAELESRVVGNDAEPEPRVIISEVEPESLLVRNEVEPESQVAVNCGEPESRVVSGDVEPQPESKAVSRDVEPQPESKVVSRNVEPQPESKVVSRDVEPQPESQLIRNDVEPESHLVSSDVEPESHIVSNDVESESHPVSIDLQPESHLVSNDVELSQNRKCVPPLFETTFIQPCETSADNTSDNNKDTDILVETTKSINQEIADTCEQPSPVTDNSTKSKAVLPTETNELDLTAADQIYMNENMVPTVGVKILKSPCSTPSEQDVELLSIQLASKKHCSCTDHSPHKASCQHEDEKIDSTANVTDQKPTESQPQETKLQTDCENISVVSISGELSVILNSVQSSECKETLINVSDQLPKIDGDGPVALDNTDGEINKSLIGLEPISVSKPSNLTGSVETCANAVIQIEADPEKLNEATSPILSTASDVQVVLHHSINADLNTQSVVNGSLCSASNFDTPLPSPSPPNEDISRLNTPAEISGPPSASDSVIPVNAPDPDLKSSSSLIMSSVSNRKVDSPVGEKKGAGSGKLIDVESQANPGLSGVTLCNPRKRKLPPENDDSSVSVIKKCKEEEATVKIRPISPTTLDQAVGLGLKINPTDLQDIVRCWQGYSRSLERGSQDTSVGRAEVVTVTAGVRQREVNVREEPRRPICRSDGLEDPIPCTKRVVEAQTPLPFNRYLLERELIRSSVLRRKIQKRTCVGETFARGIKIHQRDIGIQKRGADVVASSPRHSISDIVSTITPIRPVDRSYSRILEYLRETRRKVETESIVIQSCKDFINRVSKDAVPGCLVKSKDTVTVNTHSRIRGSSVPTPVTNWPPTSFGSTTTTVISSDSEDSNSGEHVMKGRAEVRKRSRRKDSSLVRVCSCPSPSQNQSSNVCPTCWKERNCAQGTFTPIRSSSTVLNTEVSNMQRRESERIMKCAAVGGGEENLVVHDAITVDLLKALASLAERRPHSSTTPVTTFSRSLSCDDPVPTHTEVLSLPYEKDVLSSGDSTPPLQDTSLPPVPETVRGSSARCTGEKPAYGEAPCLLEGNDVSLQQYNEVASPSLAVPVLGTPSSSSHRTHETEEELDRGVGSDRKPCESTSVSNSLSLNDSQIPPTQLTPSAENDTPSTPNSAEEAARLLSRIGKLITPDVLEDIRRLLPNMELLRPSADPSEEPPLKKRRE